MGWIWIDFALLNTFANCVLYRFFEMLAFLGHIYIYICYLLYITYYLLHIAYRLLIDCQSIALDAR